MFFIESPFVSNPLTMNVGLCVCPLVKIVLSIHLLRHRSSFLIASAILISWWILVWRHLLPIRQVHVSELFYQMNLRHVSYKTQETCNCMTKYNRIRCFWAVDIRYVLILLIFVWKNRNWYWKSLLSLGNLNLLQQLRLFLDPHGLTSLLSFPMTDYVPLSVLFWNVQ